MKNPKLDFGSLIPADWVEINLEAEFGRHFMSGSPPVQNLWQVVEGEPCNSIAPPRKLKLKSGVAR